jgi:hypothetical protein
MGLAQVANARELPEAQRFELFDEASRYTEVRRDFVEEHWALIGQIQDAGRWHRLDELQNVFP